MSSFVTRLTPTSVIIYPEFRIRFIRKQKNSLLVDTVSFIETWVYFAIIDVNLTIFSFEPKVEMLENIQVA